MRSLVWSKDGCQLTTPQRASLRRPLAPDIHDAFTTFSEQVFAEGALTARKTRQSIAVAAEMRAGAAHPHSALALHEIDNAAAMVGDASET